MYLRSQSVEYVLLTFAEQVISINVGQANINAEIC